MADIRTTLADASMAAARMHARLKLPLDRPIDIFGVVQELGIWLKSEPLGNLFGFYLQNGRATGIVLNSRHPEDLQRYTCAHELGHHVLGHQSHLDDDGDVNRLGGPLQEQAAQVFAGNFLMPLGLVNRVLRSHDLIGRPLSPVDAYQLSRDMDVSYTACIWRLRALGLLGQTTASAYAKAGAAAAKATLRGEHPVADARADVYLFDDPVDHAEVTLRVGDELWVRLPERRSSGYTWTIGPPAIPAGGLRWDGADALEQVGTDSPVEVASRTALRTAVDRSRDPLLSEVADRAEPASDDGFSSLRIGARTLREFALLADGLGEERLQLELRRTWTTEPPAASITLTVHVRPERTLDGFVPEQTAAHAARLAAA